MLAVSGGGMPSPIASETSTLSRPFRTPSLFRPYARTHVRSSVSGPQSASNTNDGGKKPSEPGGKGAIYRSQPTRFFIHRIFHSDISL
ncbi:MAG: hypothetical protein CEO12_160 [Parcubacteria group bacterium Gr01-1014_46]|nr:MAG: hypothetical protein CEO12_160 [Parcubacteria group bacterium Gr01-1014_46]